MLTKEKNDAIEVLCSALRLTPEKILRSFSTSINPLNIILDVEFDKPDNKNMDYRNRAIDKVIDLGLPFSSECNSHHEITKRFVKIVCPYCGKEMELVSGSGDSHGCSEGFRCPGCKASIMLNLPYDFFSVQPPKSD